MLDSQKLVGSEPVQLAAPMNSTRWIKRLRCNTSTIIIIIWGIKMMKSVHLLF